MKKYPHHHSSDILPPFLSVSSTVSSRRDNNHASKKYSPPDACPKRLVKGDFVLCKLVWESLLLWRKIYTLQAISLVAFWNGLLGLSRFRPVHSEYSSQFVQQWLRGRFCPSGNGNFSRWDWPSWWARYILLASFLLPLFGGDNTKQHRNKTTVGDNNNNNNNDAYVGRIVIFKANKKIKTKSCGNERSREAFNQNHLPPPQQLTDSQHHLEDHMEVLAFPHLKKKKNGIGYTPPNQIHVETGKKNMCTATLTMEQNCITYVCNVKTSTQDNIRRRAY